MLLLSRLVYKCNTVCVTKQVITPFTGKKQFPGNCQKTELTETPNAKDPSQDDKGMTKGQNGR